MTVAALLISTIHAAERNCELTRVAELPVTMSGARPTISGTINGTPVRFVVDSGATFSVLSRESAQKLELRQQPAPFGLRAVGIGGVEKVNHVRVGAFSLAGFSGGRVYNNVEFLVSGALSGSVADGIIGQNILGVSDAEYDLANGFIRLFRAKHCSGHSLAYWHGDLRVAEMRLNETTAARPHWTGTARINGKEIRVCFDSGTTRSTLGRAAATRAGIAPEDDEGRAGGPSSGFGPGTMEVVSARFDTLDLGGYVIENAQLFVGELAPFVDDDLRLGVDFFLSHRIYFSREHNRLFFTYNGGPVFDLRPWSSEQDSQVEGSSAAPSSAADFRRRGAASAARGDLGRALSDFDQAIDLDPRDPENYYERGNAYSRDGRQQLALSDFDRALELSPEHVPALIVRGALRLAEEDDTGARSDFDAAMRLDPGDAGNALGIALSFATDDHRAEAIERLDTWIDTFPKDRRMPTALNERCWSRAILGRELDLALADCNLAIRKGSRNSAVLDSRALVYLRLERFEKSIADYKAALKLQPKQASSLYGLGLAKIKNGMKAEGERDLQAAVALAPDVAEFYRKMALAP